MTRGPGATRSVGADAPTDIAAIRRQLRRTQDDSERQRLEDQLQRLERGMLDGELGRLSEALEVSEGRRRTAERTLASVATDAAAKLLAVQAQRDEAIAERDELRRSLDARPRTAVSTAPLQVVPRGRAWRALIVAILIIGTLFAGYGVVLALGYPDPISGLFAEHNQAVATRQLEALDLNPNFHNLRSRPYIRYRAAARLLNKVKGGHALGRLRIPSIGVNFVVIQGISTDDLTKGPGHYPSTTLPGLPGTFAIAGHRTTFLAPFRNLNKLHHGSRIVVSMPYGRFTYRVVDMRSVLPTDVSVIAHRTGHAKLVLTSCDPPGSASHRLVVSARPI